MSRRWPALVLRLALCGALALAAAGCGATDTPWAATAETYFARLHQAYGTGFTNLAAFYAPEVTVDHRAFDGYAGSGRTAAVQSYRDLWQHQNCPIAADDVVEVTASEPVYLSADGAVDPHLLYPALSGPVPTAFVYRIDSAGIQDEEFTGSAQAAQTHFGADLQASGAFLDGYLRAWAGSDPAAVREQYASDAVVRDSLQGLQLDGSRAIAAAARGPVSQGGLPGATLHTIPDGGGPATYGNGDLPSLGSPADFYVLLLTVDDGHGCPGEVAVALQVDQWKITHEERYHRVDAVRRCASDVEAPSGWWDQVTLPAADSVRRTGTVTTHGTDIALWNATAGLDELVVWARGRFADVPLVLPGSYPTSVTFLPGPGDCQAAFGFVPGASDVAVCTDADRACVGEGCSRWTLAAKAALLHELALGWLTSAVTDSAKAAYLRQTGLVWSDQALPWAKRGVERAAETLVWGLLDEPYQVDARLGPLSCGQLARDFHLLTGLDPLVESCAAGSG